MFWIIAVVIGALAAALMAWPLLKERAAVRNYALALVVAIPVVAILMYQQVGTPEGVGVTGTPQRPQQQQQQPHAGAGDAQFADLVRGLEQRLQENPADLEGWVLLGRSYKSAQQYAQAEGALLRAAQLAPNDALVIVELAEAKLFASGNPSVGAEVKAMLERALMLDPDQQKGLWLLGITASQEGNDALAVELWERLVGQMDPASGMAQSVRQQIDEARLRLGMQPAPADEPADDIAAGGWSGIRVEVSVPDSLAEFPPSAVLFVIARNPAMPGPPLGVIRLPNPVFPVVAFLTDADSMMPELPLSGAEELEVSARLSMTGNVIAQAGDLQSDTVSAAPTGSEAVQLVLNTN